MDKSSYKLIGMCNRKQVYCSIGSCCDWQSFQYEGLADAYYLTNQEIDNLVSDFIQSNCLNCHLANWLQF